MAKTVISFILLAVVLVLAQGVVFNHLVLWGCAVPMVYVFVLVRLPMWLSPSWVMTIGFLMGVTVDMFADTQGVNALSCTVLAFLRRGIFRFYAPREDSIMEVVPSARTMGAPQYIKYLVTMTGLYVAFSLGLEAFGAEHFWRLLVCIGASTAYTFGILWLLGVISGRSMPEPTNASHR